jgi:hypothetical protein
MKFRRRAQAVLGGLIAFCHAAVCEYAIQSVYEAPITVTQFLDGVEVGETLFEMGSIELQVDSGQYQIDFFWPFIVGPNCVETQTPEPDPDIVPVISIVCRIESPETTTYNTATQLWEADWQINQSSCSDLF